ncbi:unnamed protein product [Cladocopium goreaui]|uniref:Voltage-dependent T-type calcium channel subunit alpha-1G n=1 Tax=Cladocopium goreaui TaxID=2562237 RepID=A0A9P1BQ75_9DINO|nr:unnamed protein product [Cladocopium goreaui]
MAAEWKPSDWVRLDGASASIPGVPQNDGAKAFKHPDTYESLVNSFIEDIEEDEEAEPEDAATRMRRMFASRGTESLELFEAQAAQEGERGNEFAEARVPLVDTTVFIFGMGFVVLVNAVLIGIEVDWGRNSPVFFMAANLFFLILYLAELCFRFVTFGSGVFHDWLTVLDMILVVLVFIEQFAFPGSFARSLPAFRLIRLLRLLRTLRSLKSSPQLMAFVSNAMRIMKTLGWVTLCLFLLLWAVSAVMRNVIGRSAEWNDTYDPWQEYDPFEAFNNREYFGSVTKSFFTLLQVVTTAQWANNIARPIAFEYPMTVAFWGLFLLVTTFGLIVCVVANIVQDAIETSRVLEASTKEVERENRQNAGRRARTLLRMIDEDGDGELDFDELDAALKQKEFVQTLYSFEVPVMDAESLLRLFDKKVSGTLSFDALVNGLVGMLDDVEDKDWILLSIWSEGLHLRADTVELQCEQLLQQVVKLRKLLQHMESALKQFLVSREKTWMYYRAMAYVRSAPPPVPASVLEVLNIQVKEEIPEDEGDAFIAFARRYIGPSTRVLPPEEPPPRPPFPDVAKRLINRKAVLPPAPMPPEVYRAMHYKEEAARMAHERRFDVDGKSGGTSATFLQLKRELAVDSELLE